MAGMAIYGSRMGTSVFTNLSLMGIPMSSPSDTEGLMMSSKGSGLSRGEVSLV